MLFYDQEGYVCAYVRNRGFVYVDANSPKLEGVVPVCMDLTPVDDVESYTNPYGDVLLVHDRLPYDMCYNTVLQKLVEADRPNMFSVDDGERNPYTEMLHGDVDVELLIGADAWCRASKMIQEGAFVRLSYGSKTKLIGVYNPGDGCDEPTHLFDMRKDEFIDTFEVRCIDR